MTVLVTGGTGKTGLILSRLLKETNQSILICSRSGTAPSPYKAVKFDWFDEKTFKNPFKTDRNIDRVYLIVPSVMGQLSTVKPFIDLAISKGVKRFVLLTGSQVEIESPVLMGKVHEYLLNIKIEYTVLRPTWFIQNLGTLFYQSIREQNEIYSVARDGRFPFVSAEDIAQAAFYALISKRSPNKDYHVVGPELFSYDEVAELLSEILGRKITHRRLSTYEYKKIFLREGLQPEYADFLVTAELEAARGVEEDIFYEDEDKKFVGKHTLREYLESNRDIWIK